MSTRHFMFIPGVWIGEGKISFSASNEQIPFSTRWTIQEEVFTDGGKGSISCLQEVEMREGSEKLNNRIVLTELQATQFIVELSNETIEKVTGKGIIDPKTIAWELRDQEGFEGFEVYELQDNGEYFFHAEYASSESFRTIIDGRIWKKAFPS
ncbi:Uncharacterized protein PHSC3_001512 [Chlamydiales bacterium STE3]|nr:Uncharacterized protein PHSC3_001512 [Chlamydiales bacterium STE3]